MYLKAKEIISGLGSVLDGPALLALQPIHQAKLEEPRDFTSSVSSTQSRSVTALGAAHELLARHHGTNIWSVTSRRDATRRDERTVGGGGREKTVQGQWRGRGRGRGKDTIVSVDLYFDCRRVLCRVRFPSPRKHGKDGKDGTVDASRVSPMNFRSRSMRMI